MRLLQGESEEWEVIPEPIGKWCNIQKDGDDVYQVKTSGLSCTRPFVFRVNGLFDGAAFICLYLQELSSSQKSGGNILQMLYDKPNRWAYTFQVQAAERILSGGSAVIALSDPTVCALQSYACLSRVRTQLQSPSGKLRDAENPIQLYERSVYSDR